MSENRSWDDLPVPLSKDVKNTLKKLQFTSMTPVQASAIPLFMNRKDVAAEAVTGSGKTLAFIIPIIETLLGLEKKLGKCEIGALIISPTRELAIQISQVLQEFLDNVQQLKQLLLIGGRNLEADIKKFENEGANVVIGTPGRLDDILTGKSLSRSSIIKNGLKHLEILVLDEADRLLSLGFESALNSIFSCLPKQRRTGLFSATQTKDVEKLIRAGLRNPVLVSVREKDSQQTPSTLENKYIICQDASQKFSTLVSFLNESSKLSDKLMIFFATCACVEYFSLVLERILKKDRRIWSIHGKKAKRNKVFEDFRKAESGILICTDVMARGIDIPEVDWVLQFDPPSNAEAFVHRCGRTARIGRKGTAVLFLLKHEDTYIDFIKRNQNTEIEPLENPPQKKVQLLSQLRQWQINDRSIMDKANRAFVSFVQSYSKHQCNYVLRLKELSFGELATSFGLLKMPKMPELKNRKITGFTPYNEQDFNSIKYKDKQKERARQEKLKVFEESGKWPGLKSKPFETTAWSNKVDRKEKRDDRKRKKQLKVIQSKEEINKKLKQDMKDLDDLEDDYSVLKKMKKGKVSKEDFDKMIELDDFEDDE